MQRTTETSTSKYRTSQDQSQKSTYNIKCTCVFSSCSYLPCERKASIHADRLSGLDFIIANFTLLDASHITNERVFTSTQVLILCVSLGWHGYDYEAPPCHGSTNPLNRDIIFRGSRWCCRLLQSIGLGRTFAEFDTVFMKWDSVFQFTCNL